MIFLGKKVDIMQYLPAYLAKSKRFKAVNDADSIEHDRLRLEIEDLFAQLFIDTATWGLKFWDDFLAITEPPADVVLHRQLLKERLNKNPTSTIKFLEKLANAYIVDASANIVEFSNDYFFELHVSRDMCWNLEAVISAIELYKPAHLGWKIYEDYAINTTLNVVATGVMYENYNLSTDDSYEAPTIDATLNVVASGVFYENISTGGYING